ncbi:DUF2927 domain-containing protein [uncultured Tateyamaria sp.]|uniref:DUF2927 domain-containing protein n=1 Tax=uncultured Tateyamaria sp. TaxID=455651 RepID=UPI00261B1F36|nr:DUF2927 domain-containing protein [uncultured Tateyamaria sp.]
MIRKLLALMAIFLTTIPASAQEYIITKGPLSDRDFYRLVACAADPGGPCRKDIVRWPASKAKRLSVAITRTDPTFPERNARLIDAALTRAASEISKLEAGVTITRTTGKPDISVMLLDLPEDSVLQDTGIDDLDGNQIGAAYVHVWWDGAKRITKSVIIVTPDTGIADIKSIILEELVQSLGLLTDISNLHYRRNSIFDERSNHVKRLFRQDATAIRMHYDRK